jgi:hypothetical protein
VTRLSRPATRIASTPVTAIAAGSTILAPTTPARSSSKSSPESVR